MELPSDENACVPHNIKKALRPFRVFLFILFCLFMKNI